MGEYGTVFKRYEKKYRLSMNQYILFRQHLEDYMEEDQYGLSTICNIYYDTQNYELIRRSIESPAYKEKLRLRSYGAPKAGEPVFLELKKKYRGIVYKRRIVLPLQEACQGIAAGKFQGRDDQITREINYFLQRNPVMPKVFLAYDRIALRGILQPDLRITFDFRIRARDDRLELTQGDEGEKVIGEDEVIMEIKVKDAYPLWLVHALGEEKIRPTSFSKYGTFFKEKLLEKERMRRDVS